MMNQTERQQILSILLIAISLTACILISPARGHAQETGSTLTIQETASPDTDPSSQVQNRLTVIRELLKESEADEKGQADRKSGVPLSEIKERNSALRSLEAVYQRIITSLNRNVSLKIEEETLLRIFESEHDRPVTDTPPYSISTYDMVLDKLTAADQEEQTASATLRFIKRSFEDAKTRHELSSQKLRIIKEQIDAGKNGKDLLLLNRNYETAKIEEELAQSNLRLQKISRENTETIITLAQLKKKIAQRDADWIKAHLAFDQEDLNKHLGKINEKRNELRERIAVLMQEQQEVESRWLEARKQVEASQGAKEEVKARAASYLKAREAWRGTYQSVLEQTEVINQMLNLEEQLWQRRYAILSPDLDYGELKLWKDEAATFIKSVEAGVRVVQARQNKLQSQMIAVEKQLSEEGADPVIKENAETQMNALRKSSDRELEFLSLVLGARELQQRLINEIDSRRRTVPLKGKVESLWNNILKLWEFELWVINERSVTVHKVFIALLIFILGMVLTRVITQNVGKRLLTATHLDQTAAAAVEKVLYYVALLFIILFALRTVNIPLTVFTIFGGAIAIGIGFGAQNLINNFISGFILMVERPVKIGDVIEVDSNYGIVEDIGTRCTRVRTPGNMHILVPNSSFLEKNIVNWTLADHEIRAQISVGVVYGSDTRLVKKLTLRTAKEHDKVMDYPEPFVLFSEFGDNALMFDLYFWVRIQRVMDRRKIESDLRFRIDNLFREAGIIIAFPQRDVHLDTLKPLDVRVVDSGDPSDRK
jgi:small-conductance mechanosensitive channel